MLPMFEPPEYHTIKTGRFVWNRIYSRNQHGQSFNQMMHHSFSASLMRSPPRAAARCPHPLKLLARRPGMDTNGPSVVSVNSEKPRSIPRAGAFLELEPMHV